MDKSIPMQRPTASSNAAGQLIRPAKAATSVSGMLSKHTQVTTRATLSFSMDLQRPVLFPHFRLDHQSLLEYSPAAFLVGGKPTKKEMHPAGLEPAHPAYS